MKRKNYYFNYASKLLAMSMKDCAAHLDAIAKNNEEERNAIVSQFSKVIALGGVK